MNRRPKKPVPCETVQINEIVSFKMRGFCIWPGRVISIINNVVEVEFFGDKSTQKSVLGPNICKFDDSAEQIICNLRNIKSPLYRKAVREAEIFLGVPESQSILNRI